VSVSDVEIAGAGETPLSVLIGSNEIVVDEALVLTQRYPAG